MAKHAFLSGFDPIMDFLVKLFIKKVVQNDD